MESRSVGSRTADIDISGEKRVHARRKSCVQSIVPSKCSCFPNGVCQNVIQDGAPPSLLLSEKAGTAVATDRRENGIPVTQDNEDVSRKQWNGN